MENIKADLDRYFKNNSRSLNPSVKKKIKIIGENYGVHAIFVYRFGYWIESIINDKKLNLFSGSSSLHQIVHFLPRASKPKLKAT